jgi:hypothetical protein
MNEQRRSIKMKENCSYLENIRRLTGSLFTLLTFLGGFELQAGMLFLDGICKQVGKKIGNGQSFSKTLERTVHDYTFIDQLFPIIPSNMPKAIIAYYYQKKTS